MKTILYRFSKDGFIPYYQAHHVEDLELGLKHFKENIEEYPIHLRHHIAEGYNAVIPEWKDFTEGVFTFVGMLPDKETMRILLNHLDKEQKETYTWWTAEIDINQYCFDVNDNKLWRNEGFCKIKDMVDNMNYEIFIPKQFLKVENVQQWTNDYRSIFHNSSKDYKIKKIKP